MKKICQEESRGWHGQVRVNASGCLGRCKKGIAAVLYPEGKWFENLKSTDTETLTQAISKAVETT
jgi:(2Fe-2S) ferredoxin